METFINFKDKHNEETNSTILLENLAQLHSTTTLITTAKRKNFKRQFDKSELQYKDDIYRARTFKIVQLIHYFIHPSNNWICRKLYDSPSMLLKEKIRARDFGKWVIHPFSMFRILWDSTLVITLLLNLVVIPLSIAFDIESTAWEVFLFLNDAMFVIDLFLNMRTGIPNGYSITGAKLNPRLIFMNYMKTWLVIDVLSCFPFRLLFDQKYAQTTRLLKILRLAKLTTLIRIAKMTKLLKLALTYDQLYIFIRSSIRTIKIVMAMMLVAHWNGCFMFYSNRFQHFPEDGWVYIDGIIHDPWYEQYSWSFFRALSNMLGIGFGLHPPQNQLDLWMTIVSMMSGATCYAMFIGQATTLVQQLTSSRRLYADKKKQLQQYLIFRKIPIELQSKIHRFFEIRYKGKIFDENEILDQLNFNLRQELLNYTRRDLIRVVPMFHNADPVFLSAIIENLHYDIFQSDDFIISKDQFGSRMYFLLKGSAEVINEKMEIVKKLADGDYFGEIGLLLDCRRTAYVRAATLCEVYYLLDEDFHKILNKFPAEKAYITRIAADRCHEIGINLNERSKNNVSKDKLRTILRELTVLLDSEI